MDDNKKPLQELIENTRKQIVEDYKKETSDFKKKNGSVGTIVLYCFLAVLVIVGILMVRKAISVGTDSFKDSYNNKKESISSEIYQKFYDEAEKKYHVTNRATINLGNIREESKLEVLKVIESTCVIQTDKERSEGNHRWVKYTGEGIFTIDLTISEFLVNNDKHYVLIRIPEPSMTEFQILNENTEYLMYAYDKLIGNGSIEQGVSLSMDFQARAYTEIKNSIYDNQNYFIKAKESAKEELTKIVKLLNSTDEMSDLVVEIEFFD